ncbi:nitrite reductase [Portibacter lacus]|uniref:Ferredoxin--nitrite reductase n=1 Tax=Portibacter lacus TaxID=1099794 RepID=A0AA37SQY2_9BACT|nr:nitrite reductase [Portibacter lacus]GLR18325.1 ferredoxin--nitrite reductase [Portibacter lacus]
MSVTSRTQSQFIADAQADVEELKYKIDLFKKGQINEDKFKHYRLTRGVYGQRQLGVHMFRTKIPFGYVSADQLYRLADISDAYATGNLHITTRQNIQFHYVKLANSPKVWELMAEVGMNAREACGNTVRNITASSNAGIDPEELFDITPYVVGVYNYFLRNPICQEMGRKIKIAFSSSDADSAFCYFHDFGFIPRIENGVKGFKLLLAGGLGAQSMEAVTVTEFIPTDEIIPFMEAAIRVFDRYGEREKRFKARMKFLLKSFGQETLTAMIYDELASLPNKKVHIAETVWKAPEPIREVTSSILETTEDKEFELWKQTNLKEIKDTGYYSVNIKVRLGDISSGRARALAQLVKKYFADDIRFTVHQGILLRYAAANDIEKIYKELKIIGLADYGAETILDVTACPGTDTCNLGVTNSTSLAEEIELHIKKQHQNYLTNEDISIKISGCMNACGQHMAASIGLHGSSIKINGRVLPAMQIVLGGGVVQHKTYIAEKIIKIGTKRIPQAITLLLEDYEGGANIDEHFTEYVVRQGKKYFYDLLKGLADKKSLTDADFLDWGHQEDYVQAIGVGECAGVAFDMLSAIVKDADEKVESAIAKFKYGEYGEAIYHAYTSFIVGAKAMLLSADVKCNTHIKILDDFNEVFGKEERFQNEVPFTEYVLRMKTEEASKEFAAKYIEDASAFNQKVHEARNETTSKAEDQLVTSSYYNA